MTKQPWLYSAKVDSIFILLPPFLCLALIAFFPGFFLAPGGMPDFAWVVLILMIDVAHVYSTLFRTYFDPLSFKKQRGLLLTIPFIGFVTGVMLYSINPLLFWRVLAYVAVFHFIRQQYGFLRIYARKETQPKWGYRVDALMIYSASIYPLLIWHLQGPREFNWFLENDFLYFSVPFLQYPITAFYILICLLYYRKEWLSWKKARQTNFPKWMVVIGTQVSWYFGIVYFNGDLAFTLLNVVSHGIPYMALIWIYGRKNYAHPEKGSSFLRIIFSQYGWILFLLILFAFAFVEEGIWDWGVWQENGALFGWRNLSKPILSDKTLAFLVPLLALPQITHYILDGFIWKIKKDESNPSITFHEG